MAEIEISGVKLNLDLDDLNVAGKVEEAIKEAKEKAEAEKNTTDYVGSGLKVCAIVEECLDSAFGDGTAQKIFGGRKKFREHIDAFTAFADAVYGQMKEQGAYVNGLSAKYSPNRVARRHPAKK
jgi:hypothetical protein